MDNEHKKRLYLVDGANYLFRAFYAIRPLSNSQGLPTNALYGFTQMILSLIRDEKPDYLCIVLDTKEPTFRHKLYPKYKANRKDPPDDLIPQFPYVRPVLDALNICMLDKAGFEADDIIGTLAQRFASEQLEVVIASGDKDLLQLVNSNVYVLDTMKEKRLRAAEVKAKFGVDPNQVVDVLGLSGDSSDNIPGVPGVGPKTASKLIQEYESIDGILANIDKLTGKLKTSFTENIDLLKLSKKLATIDCAVSLQTNIDDFLLREPKQEKLQELFTELGFHKLLTELAPAATLSREGYQLLQTMPELRNLLQQAKAKQAICIDLETTSLNTMSAEIVGIALAVEEGKAFYVPVAHQLELGDKQLDRKETLRMLAEVLQDPKVEVIGQNLKYDLKILKRYGVDAKGKLFDTMLASYLLNPSARHGMDAMAQEHLGHTTIKYEEVAGKGKKQLRFDSVPLAIAMDYAAEDADVTLRLANLFKTQLQKTGLLKLYDELEEPLLHTLIDMELSGILLDKALLAQLSAEFKLKLNKLEKQIYEEAGDEFNINSPRQLGEILFGKLALPGAKKNKTGYSTRQDILEGLASEHVLPKLILEYRSFAKLQSTYVEALPNLVDENTGRLHTTLNQTIAATGRLTSSEPNLQNIPIRSEAGKKIRQAFTAAPGFLLLDCDYSQIELRVLAHMSADPILIDAFKNNLDIHAMTAAEIYGCKVSEVSAEQRSVGKTINFSTIYGQGSHSLAKQLAISPAQAKDYIASYFKRYPKVAEYRETILQQTRNTQVVETLFGRRRFFPDITAPNQMVKQAAERMAFNTVFQGTAADIVKRAMIAIHAELPNICSDAKMLLQVHDELIFEVPAAKIDEVAKFVQTAMESAANLSVPLLADLGIGENWAEAH